MSNEPDKIIYSMIRVSKRHGQREVLKDISLSYFYGAKIGVLGLNGSGKSSLLKILAGVDQAFEGKTVLAPGYTIGYLEQEPLVNETRTVREVVEEGAQELVNLVKEFEEINAKFAEPMEPEEMDKLIERQGQVQELMDAKGAWDLDSKLEMAMDALRCPPGDTPVSVISGGEKRRVALCRLLLQNPDILLLDEPTNHLDAESVAWLERYLQNFPGTVIAVTHDRYFLDNVAGWILELDRGRGIPWKGNYSSWLEQKEKRLAQEDKAEDERRKTLKRELEWIRMSPKGRHAKGKARINAYEAMLSHESEKRAPELEIYIPAGPRLGKKVIEAVGVCKALGDKELMENVNFIIPAGAIVGIIGPNGAGKTTLMRMIAGIMKPTGGEIRYDGIEIGTMGEKYRDIFGYLPQEFGFYPGFSVQDYLEYMAALKGIGKRETKEKIQELLELVSLTDVRKKKISKLSGGMKRRVGIAQALLNEPKVLILDEPTSGLDPGERMRFRNLLSEFGRNRIVLISTHIVSDVEYIATCNAVMKNGKIAAVGETEELVKEVEGKVWNVVLDMAEVMTYETKIPVVNIYNREDGKTVLRYLAERPVIPGSEPADARMEDLYLWMFPEQGREEVR